MKLQLLVADTIETLASGKMVLLGVYTDRVIVLELPPDLPDPPVSDHPVGLDLAFLVTITEIEPGSHTAQLKFLDPDGRPVHEPRPGVQVVAPELGGLNILMRRVPMPVRRLGVHKVIVTVDDDEELTASFELRRKVPYAAEATKAPTQRKSRKAKPH